MGGWVPAQIAGGAGGADGGGEHTGEALEIGKGFRSPESAATGNDNLSVFEADAFGFGLLLACRSGAEVGLSHVNCDYFS